MRAPPNVGRKSDHSGPLTSGGEMPTAVSFEDLQSSYGMSLGDNPEEFLEHTKLELFHDQVFCFTPKGQLIALPRGATPIDFAYAVHTDIGDTCVGAKINGRIMPRVPMFSTNQANEHTLPAESQSFLLLPFVNQGAIRGPY